jgi:DNA polymerase, archaea type
VNPLLEGHSGDERIVAVQLDEQDSMRMYTRTGDAVNGETASFFPFFHLADRWLLDGFSPKHWLKELSGPGEYRYLCVVDDWPTFWEAIRYCISTHNRSSTPKVQSYQELKSLHVTTDPGTQFLMQTGRTLFKGMEFHDVRRMQIDIETYTAGGRIFSSASRAADRIILIAMGDSTGWRHVIDGRKMDEAEMLASLVSLVRERDPDVIEGHNIFNFDLPYILARCQLHHVPPAFGRDGLPPRSFDARAAYADQAFEYTVTEIPGRHVVDTLMLVQSYDATKRNMESHGLKYVARYFGFARPDRVDIPGDRISWTWDHEPDRLVEYALDDIEETAALATHLSGSSFALTQMLPIPYGLVARMGAAGKIESLLAREYLRQKHALPRPQEGVQTSGGYTNVYMTGVIGPVLHADVESLYPSVMLSNAIAPASDDLGIFLGLLRELTTARLAAKRKLKTVDDPREHSRLDALQSSFKILINSFYGYLGYARGIFNDYAQADRVTRTGQAILKSMITEIRKDGGTPIEVDTDGIFFGPPGSFLSAEESSAYVESLTSRMPQGITIALSGRYKRMLSYKMKNYALLEYDGKIRIKGSSLISRAMERFGREYVKRCVECLLRDDIAGLHAAFLETERRITERKLTIEEFARVETLKDPIEVYEEEVLAGRRNRSAAYQVAIQSGRNARQGERIAYYITGRDPNAVSSANCRAADEWDPHFPDENTGYYLRRLQEYSDKFTVFFSPSDHQMIFSSGGLFPFDPADVTPIIVTTDAAESETKTDDATGEQPGIWLGDE